ncbi:MFS transporter [Micromonospora sp. NPDC049801]|uniref:MFS transporter n=1 Tax=unclassified Micromonospora TaxID=2617518 RepID=UPI003401252D
MTDEMEQTPSRPGLKREFRLLLTSQGVSGFGDVLALVAIPFAMLALDKSGFLTGLVLAARTIAQVAVLLLGSVAVDRFPPRPLMIAADLVAFGTQASIGMLIVFGNPSAWQLVALFAVNGAAAALYIPATSKILAGLATGRDLQTANAGLSMTFTSVGILGFPLAGLLVSVTSPGVALLADALTFLTSALLLTRIRGIPATVAQSDSSWAADFVTGVKEVARTPWLTAGLANAGMFQMLVLGMLPVLGPLLAIKHYDGVAGWSALLLASSLGMLAGGFASTRFVPKRPLLAAYTATALGVAPGLILLATGAPLPITLAGMFVYGVALAIFNTLWGTTVQQRVPGKMLGRVSALDGFVSYGCRPLGLLLAVPVAAATSPLLVVVISAVAVALLAATVCAVPVFRGEEASRRLRERPDVSDPAAPQHERPVAR